jgi:hypothetical protein
MSTMTRAGTGPDIEGLLRLHKTMRMLMQSAHELVDPNSFPESVRAVAALAKKFEAELEVNLMRAYEAAPAPADDRFGRSARRTAAANGVGHELSSAR